VWLTGPASAVLSLSATAPTGVTDGKYLAGWIYNDSGSDIFAFRTEPNGDSLDVWWDATPGTHSVVSVAGTQPTSTQTVNTATGGHAPPASVFGLHLNGESYNEGTIKLTWGSVAAHQISANTGLSIASFQVYLPTQSSSVGWAMTGAGGAGDQTSIYVAGFRFDRSGV